MKCAPPIYRGRGHENKVLCNEVTNAQASKATKMANVCCDRLLLAHSAKFGVILIFVFFSRKIFLVRPFCVPLPAAPGGNCPSAAPPRYA